MLPLLLFSIKPNKVGRIVAIDYGKKRVGIAVTDELQMFATGLTTVPAQDIFVFLKNYFDSETIDEIIVGKATQMNGSDSESMVYATPFFNRLKKLYPTIRISWFDERFTSKMASAAISLSGLKKKDREDKALIDKVSATILLQSYLESKTYIQNK